MEGEGSGKVEVAEDKGREIKIWCGEIAGEKIDFRIFGFWLPLTSHFAAKTQIF